MKYLNDDKFMERALVLAQSAADHGNEPFGALLVKDNKIVGTNENKIHTESDPTSHAELGLIRKFCSENNIQNLSEYTMYTSCEPCCMCSGAIVWANVGRVVYSLSHDELAKIAGFNIMISSNEIFLKSPHKPETIGGLLSSQAAEIYKNYFK
ncbi:nucleoside deaminase [Enterococcus faecalis]